MVFYLASENDLISLQLLLVLNLSNIFIMFFMFFTFIHNNNIVYQQITPVSDNLVARYEITFDDILNIVYPDNFPHNEKCSICLEEFLFSSDETIIETDCNHYFHETCIKPWLRIRTRCPNCQSNLVARYIQDN